MQRDVVNAVADLRFRVGNIFRMQSLIDRFPRLSAIIGAERSGRRDRDENALRIFWREENRVEAQSTSTGLPFRAGPMTAQSGQLLPILTAILRFEQGW